MAASDFVKATSFKLRDDVVQDDKTINLRATSTAVPAPGTLIVGSRFFIQYAPTNRDYYAVLNAVVPVIATGVTFEWVGVQITPKIRRNYDADDKVSFEPWAVIKKPFPLTVSVKENESGSLNLGDYFELRGGSGSIHYIAKPQGPGLAVSISGSTLIYKGSAEGVVRLSIEARDSAQGTVSQTLTVNVLHANRRPRSLKALGNPSLTVGGSIAYNLHDYFTDDDGDTLSFVAGGGGGYASVLVDGSTLTIRGLDVGQVTIAVDASDGTLEVSQQMRITVSANRRPIVSKIIPHQAITVGGNPVVLDIDDYFSDPDAGNVLSWLVQFEVGNPLVQFSQEFWSVTAKTGSNQLTLESLYSYPPGSDAPWGSGTAWSVPAGTSFTFRSAFATDPAIRLFRGTLLSTAVASWDGTARRVLLTLRSAETLPVGNISPPSRLIFGDAVVWAEGDHMNLNLIPGDILGTRNLYVSAFDNVGLFASQIFATTLHHGPEAIAVPDQAINVGQTFLIDFSLIFSHLDNDPLTYIIEGYDNVVIQPRIIKNTLQVIGLTNGNTDLSLIAVDEHFETITNTIRFQVRATRPEDDLAPLVPLSEWAGVFDRQAITVEFEEASSVLAPTKKEFVVRTDAPEGDNTIELRKRFKNYIRQADDSLAGEGNVAIPTPSVFVFNEQRYGVFLADGGLSFLMDGGLHVDSGNFFYFISADGKLYSVRRGRSTSPPLLKIDLATFHPNAVWRGLARIYQTTTRKKAWVCYDSATGFIRVFEEGGSVLVPRIDEISSLEIQASTGGKDIAVSNTSLAANSTEKERIFLLFDDRIEVFSVDNNQISKGRDITVLPTQTIGQARPFFDSVGIAVSGRTLLLVLDLGLESIVNIGTNGLVDNTTYRNYDIDLSTRLASFVNPLFLSTTYSQSSTADPFFLVGTDAARQIYRSRTNALENTRTGTSKDFYDVSFSPPLLNAVSVDDTVTFIDHYTLRDAVQLPVLIQKSPGTAYLDTEFKTDELVGYVLPELIPPGTTLTLESVFSLDGEQYRVTLVEMLRQQGNLYLYRFTASLVPN